MLPGPELVNELIRSRRSVFPADYVNEPVDETIVQQMLENANWAPTHKITEPWRFVVFTGAGLSRLAALQSDLYRKVTMKDGTFRDDKYTSLQSKPLAASHVIAIGLHRDPENRVPIIEEVGAVFCAIQNMYLTAAAYGVGCYLGTGGITYFEEASALFGFDELIGFLYIGTPRKDLPLSSRRRPIDEKVVWNK